jgi:hypothetical protein
VFHKDDRVKQSLNDLQAARLELRIANAKLDSAMELNKFLLENNKAFQQKVKTMDSVLKIAEHRWSEKEQRLLIKLDEMKKSVSVLSHRLETTGAHLPELPVGELSEVEQNQKNL